MRLYRILDEKVRQFSQDAEIQALLAEIHGAHPGDAGLLARYTRQSATKLKGRKFDVNGLAKRRLPYERLDHCLNELLLGVR